MNKKRTCCCLTQGEANVVLKAKSAELFKQVILPIFLLILAGAAGTAMISAAGLIAPITIVVGLTCYVRHNQSRIPKQIPLWQIGLIVAMFMLGAGLTAGWLSNQPNPGPNHKPQQIPIGGQNRLLMS